MPQADVFSSRVCLRPGIELVPARHGRMLIRSQTGTVLISGEFGAQAFTDFVGKLDGRHTFAALTQADDADRRTRLVALVQELHRRGLVELLDEVPSLPSPSSSGPVLHPFAPHEAAYWALRAGSAETAAHVLRSHTVLVCGLGGVGRVVAQALAAGGIGSLLLADSQPVRGVDSSFGYAAEAIGLPRAQALARELAQLPSIPRVVALGSADWASSIADASLVVLAGDNMAMAHYDTVNEACLRHHKPWVSARIDRDRAWIGPYVVPTQTACFTCFEMRHRANAAQPEDHEAIYAHWRKLETCPDDWPLLPPMLGLVGNLLALDVLGVLGARQVSAMHGRVLSLAFANFESRLHEVLKLPRCPACSRLRGQPMQRIWDIPADAPRQVTTS